jgi:hypothetical protein
MDISKQQLRFALVPSRLKPQLFTVCKYALVSMYIQCQLCFQNGSVPLIPVQKPLPRL